MELNREDERPDVVMTVKDKDDINKFASNLAKRNDLREKITRNKKLIQLYDDASDEMVIMDDDAEVFYNVGDVFIMDDKSHVEVMLEKTKEDLTEDVGHCEEELESVEKEMSVLKASLYAKFGKVRSNRSDLFINSYSAQLTISSDSLLLHSNSESCSKFHSDNQLGGIVLS